MDDQTKDLKLEKCRKRLSQTRKKSAKTEARKKESKFLKRTGSKDCMYKFHLLKFF